MGFELVCMGQVDLIALKWSFFDTNSSKWLQKIRHIIAARSGLLGGAAEPECCGLRNTAVSALCYVYIVTYLFYQTLSQRLLQGPYPKIEYIK